MKIAHYTWDLADPAIIEQNRQGLLTSQQRSLLLPSWPIFESAVYLFMLALTTSPFWWPGGERPPAFMVPLYLLIFGGMSLLVVSMSLFAWWRAWVGRDEIQYGLIAQTTGEVVQQGQGYVAQIPGARLRTVINKVDLLPGRYHFYYLPRSRYLLSAEPLTVDIPVAQAVLRQNLGRHFAFSEDDLVRNRQGQLSERQQWRLGWQAVGYGVLSLIFLGLLLLGFIASTSRDADPLPWQMACVTLLLLGSLVWSGREAVIRLADMAGAKNKVAVGPVQVLTRSRGRATAVYYVVQGIELEVGVHAYAALVEGLSYRVYYTPHSKKIVSLEPV